MEYLDIQEQQLLRDVELGLICPNDAMLDLEIMQTCRRASTEHVAAIVDNADPIDDCVDCLCESQHRENLETGVNGAQPTGSDEVVAAGVISESNRAFVNDMLKKIADVVSERRSTGQEARALMRQLRTEYANGRLDERTFYARMNEFYDGEQVMERSTRDAVSFVTAAIDRARLDVDLGTNIIGNSSSMFLYTLYTGDKFNHSAADLLAAYPLAKLVWTYDAIEKCFIVADRKTAAVAMN